MLEGSSHIPDTHQRPTHTKKKKRERERESIRAVNEGHRKVDLKSPFISCHLNIKVEEELFFFLERWGAWSVFFFSSQFWVWKSEWPRMVVDEKKNCEVPPPNPRFTTTLLRRHAPTFWANAAPQKKNQSSTVCTY